MKTVSFLASLAIAALAGMTAGCTDLTSATNLNPEGPPMIRQVRLLDNFADSSGAMKEAKIFAFGTHKAAINAKGEPDPDQQHHANAASALNNGLRIIMDEILVGNNLEEIECRATVDDDAFASVPLGATPQDVANCSAPRDVLPRTCIGENRVCVCERDGGCTVNGTGIDKGLPVGVLDADEDGAADNTRFINGAVGISCGGVSVPIDLDKSYWTPSGDQNVPAMGGFEVLGPAIVLTPTAALRTNSDCKLVFADSIVDKENNRVCAPANGDITMDCEPGDVDAFTFKVQPLVLTPQLGENAMNVARTDFVIVDSNVPLDAAAGTKLTITEAGANYTGFTVTLQNMNRQFEIAPAGGTFAANTKYIITFPITVTDAAGSPLPMPYVLTFTTGAT